MCTNKIRVKDPITCMVQPMGNEGDIGQIVEFVYVRKRRLRVKKLFGFCRYEKRSEFGLQKDKKEQKIYPQSVNSACKQYCEY